MINFGRDCSNKISIAFNVVSISNSIMFQRWVLGLRVEILNFPFVYLFDINYRIYIDNSTRLYNFFRHWMHGNLGFVNGVMNLSSAVLNQSVELILCSSL